jgi:acyl transferase domain-containing protein
LSSFGAGGSNAHLIVEEFPGAPPRAGAAGNAVAIVLSAWSEERLASCARRLTEALARSGFTDADLGDIAYTLQTGREALPHRLALVASTLRDACELLAAFLAGDRGRCHVGVAEPAPADTRPPSVDARTLDAWVRGELVDWESAYRGRAMRRVRLPTYPFARERYWAPDAFVPVPEAPATSAERDSTPAPATLHPLTADAPPAPARVPVIVARAAPVAVVEAQLRESLASALYMKPQDVGLHTNVVDLGLDSVVGVEWIRAVNKQLGLSLAAARLYDYPTVSELAAYIVSQQRDADAAVEVESIDALLEAVYAGTTTIVDAQRWLGEQQVSGRITTLFGS